VTRAIRVLALCSLLAVVSPARAFAEWQLAPFVGLSFLGDTNIALTELPKRHWNFGGIARLVGAGPIGVEAVVLYVPGAFKSFDVDPLFLNPTQNSETITQSRAFAMMGNVVLTTPRAWNQYGLRPYASGGFGLLHVFHNDLKLPLRANLPAYNVGGGAVGFIADRVGLRFDLRYYRTTPPGIEPTELALTADDHVRVRFWTGTVGVVFKY
jgi:hypothetical protein